MVGDDKAQDGIPKELKTFVGGHAAMF